METTRIILLFLALAVIMGTAMIVTFLFFNMREHGQVHKRVSEMLIRRHVNVELEESLIVAAPKINFEQVVLTLLPTLEPLRQQFKRANININIGLYVMGVTTIALAMTFGIKTDYIPGWIEPPLYLLAAHILFARIFLSFRVGQVRQQMLKQMPTAIDMIVRGLRVGQSLDAALKSVTGEIEPPLEREFKKITAQLNAGTPVTDALENVAEEIGLKEFDFFATACRVQLESGGNLADALVTLSETIRARHNLRLKIKALSAEGKMSAIVISALPPFLILYFHFVNPEYIEPLFKDPRGQKMLTFAILLILGGGMWMARLVRIKV